MTPINIRSRAAAAAITVAAHTKVGSIDKKILNVILTDWHHSGQFEAFRRALRRHCGIGIRQLIRMSH